MMSFTRLLSFKSPPSAKLSAVCISSPPPLSLGFSSRRRYLPTLSVLPHLPQLKVSYWTRPEPNTGGNMDGSRDRIVKFSDNGLRKQNDSVSRKKLPQELSRNVVVLNCESTAGDGTCDVYLVGTAHVSKESCREVQSVIKILKPEVVFLELCSGRATVLTPRDLKVPTMQEMIKMWKKRQNMFGILYSWFLAKVASRLEVLPGAEFHVALEEAKKYGAKVILGDRPVQITLQRTWAKMPFWHKTKLVSAFLLQAVFLPGSRELNKMLKEMDDVDMLTAVIQEMSKEFPTLMETLVHERDQYMSYHLLTVAREHSSVVAVVGKGHLLGIKRYWKQPVVIHDLLETPSQNSSILAVKVVASLSIVVAGAAVISGIYSRRNS